MQKKPLITAVLTVSGKKSDVSMFGALVGLNPTQLALQPINGSKSDTEGETFVWRYKLVKREHWSLGEAVDELLDMVWEKREEIKQFIAEKGLKLRIRLVPLADASEIEYIIEGCTVQRLAFLMASISIASYCKNFNETAEAS